MPSSVKQNYTACLSQEFARLRGRQGFVFALLVLLVVVRSSLAPRPFPRVVRRLPNRRVALSVRSSARRRVPSPRAPSPLASLRALRATPLAFARHTKPVAGWYASERRLKATM